MKHSSNILHYWRAVEIFCPQSVPKVQPDNRKTPTNQFEDAGAAAPWDKRHAVTRRRIGTDAWRHEVYAGVYPVRLLRDLLQDKFGVDPESYDERLDIYSALFSITVSNDGRPLFDTAVLSTCAWAWGRTISPGPDAPDWLEGYDGFAEKFDRRIRQELALRDGDTVGAELASKEIDVGRPITLADISALSDWLLTELGIVAPRIADTARICSRRVPKRYAYDSEGADFLNSFFIDDLNRVASHIEAGDAGAALHAYLAADEAVDETGRIDVRQELQLPFNALAPNMFPPGRWPSKGHHPLAYGQQFAINQLTRELGQSEGLFGVNGPPGTGKTTLLRDQVASVVVSRALALEKLKSPADAFVGEAKLKAQEKERTIKVWSEAFSGFEMVVASANNGAVENITLDIPGIDAIDPKWAHGFDYFTDFASRVIDEPAWGLLAARLGNKANRAAFRSRFWKDEEADSSRTTADEDTAPRRGFSSWLYAQNPALVDWSSAKTRFRQALAAESELRKQRQGWFESIGELADAEVREKDLLSRIGQRTQAEANAVAAMEFAVGELDRATADLASESESVAGHRKRRPGIVRVVLSLGRAYKSWRTEHDGFVEREREARSHAEKAAETTKTLTEISRAATDLRTGDEERLLQLRATVGSLRAMLEEAKRVLGKHFPALETWKSDDVSREKSSPWADSAWNGARARVFLEALNLHKAFVISQADVFGKNLTGLFDILQGSVPPDASHKAVRAAWQTLFFIVPVVSTTFASFDRLFAHLGREELGWLLIDEAGQAVPQSAAGAIWRARRAIVVGDPLQLEPVLTIPFSAQQALRKRFGVSETWLPGRLSAQKLTDRASKVGTALIDHERNPLWVSSPLRVHRRCDEKMFRVSNKIAYNNLMVFGTEDRKALNLPETAWIHVESADAEEHWVPAEGQMVLSILRDVIPETSDKVYVISPFRDVVRGLEALLAAQQYPAVEVGTIHTVQGKESDVVLLVLGGNPKKPGAKNWASKKPNLLNVAVSRAKRRLYIVGNRNAWKAYDNFAECSAIFGPQNVWPPKVESYLQ
ncbi:DEAD/DEAH box helicase [Paraburkholderia sp. BCC1876]|uniref:DEAD/DEAH box helicase n=1 Tax=Paraburkholderia sp. BCC1876 TaxID=2676303 RepID=UPI0015914A27|nr:DEAD/DEAH box helicase [Paraburkholderia sp. BCC1876]